MKLSSCFPHPSHLTFIKFYFLFIFNIFIKGALYGGLISLCLVVYIGIMALLQNGEVEPLPVSLESCACFVSNSTQSIANENDIDTKE